MPGGPEKHSAGFSRNAGWLRLYGILLRLYPLEFRQAYGEAMACIFEESLAEARLQSGCYGVFRLGLDTLADLAKTVLTEQASRFAAAFGIEQKASLGVSVAIHGVLLAGILWVGFHTIHPVRNSCYEQKITRASAMR